MVCHLTGNRYGHDYRPVPCSEGRLLGVRHPFLCSAPSLTDQLLRRCHSSFKHLILEVYTLESVLMTAVPHSEDVDAL
jgi:hypothetical protein